MPSFEVVFIYKDDGNSYRSLVDWNSLAVPNLNHIVKRGNSKICHCLNCSSRDLIFRSVRAM